MPLNINDAGTPKAVTPYVNQGGDAVECNVYVNQSGEAVLVHSVTEPVEIDTFDDGDLAEYDYNYNTGDHSVVSSPAVEGSALRRDSTSWFGKMASTGGLESYPEPGDSWEFYVRSNNISDQCDAWHLFGVQDESNHYAVLTDFNTNDLAIEVWENSEFSASRDVARDTSVDLYQANAWHRVRVDWETDGTITAEVFSPDESQSVAVSGQDSTFGAGGIGWASDILDNGKNVYWDQCVNLTAGDGSGDDGGGDNQPEVIEIVENFEDDPDGPYASGETITDYYTKTTGPDTYSRAQVGVEGTYAVDAEPTGWHNYASESGLGYYPQDGDVISGLLYAETPDDGSNNPQPHFAWYVSVTNGATNGYAVMPGNLSSDYAIELRRWDEDSSNQLAVGTEPLNAAEWYDFEVEISGDTFTARVFEVDQSTGERVDPETPIEEISATDSTHAPTQGFAFGNRGAAGTGSVSRIDHVRKIGTVATLDADVIDNFETSPAGFYDSSESITDYYTQTSGSDTYTRDSVGIEGLLAATTSAPSSDNHLVATSGDGVNYLPQDGDIFSAYVYASSPDGNSSNPQPYVGWYANDASGTATGHVFTFGPASRSYAPALGRINDGSYERIGEDGTASIQMDTWYDVEITLDGASYTAEVYAVDQSTGDRTDPSSPIGSVSVADSLYSGDGGFIFGNIASAGTGSEVRIDGVRKVGEV